MAHHTNRDAGGRQAVGQRLIQPSYVFLRPGKPRLMATSPMPAHTHRTASIWTTVILWRRTSSGSTRDAAGTRGRTTAGKSSPTASDRSKSLYGHTASRPCRSSTRARPAPTVAIRPGQSSSRSAAVQLLRRPAEARALQDVVSRANGGCSPMVSSVRRTAASTASMDWMGPNRATFIYASAIARARFRSWVTTGCRRR